MMLPTALEMQNLDRCAIDDFGVPGIVLMENAGLGTVKMMEEELGSCHATFAVIFVGPGNNGGDGLVIARHLHQRGCQPVIFFLVDPNSLKDDTAVNLNIIHKLKIPFHIVDNSSKVQTIPILCKQFETRGRPCYAVIDAIFGIGLHREITSHFAEAVSIINKLDFVRKPPVISVDTPSGLDVDTGEILGICVYADYTATYCCAKPGHYIHGNHSLTGKLTIIDIGIPPEAVQRANITTKLSTPQNVKSICGVLNRQRLGHKGTHGHILMLAGARGKTGAGILTAKGAQRAGVGLISMCVPHKLNTIFESLLVEAMTLPLPHSSSFFLDSDTDIILQHTKGKQAVVIGPGIGTAPETAAIVVKLYQTLECPLVLDADALNILAANRDASMEPPGARIFTPHPGELSRLLDKPIDTIQANRLDSAELGCNLFPNKNHETVMVLKGAGTIITSNDGSTVINTTGNPGMGTGGTGDVLSGIIGAFIAQGMTAKDAAVAGTHLHGLAGDMLYQESGSGFSATEVADTIPYALKSIFNE